MTRLEQIVKEFIEQVETKGYNFAAVINFINAAKQELEPKQETCQSHYPG